LFADTQNWKACIKMTPSSPHLRASNTNSAWDNDKNRLLLFGGYNAEDGIILMIYGNILHQMDGQ